MNHTLNLKTLVLGGLMSLAATLHVSPAQADTEKLVVAGGCFWCVESDFESVPGVKSAVAGYIGGPAETATYKKVSQKDSGHYEAVEITFDTDTISREELLHKFFRSVDPTDAGGQFCDRGDSYRTAVFYNSDAQKTAAENAKAQAQAELGQTVVTPVLAATEFFAAEDYHQDYYKGTQLILTRFGPKKQSKAYKLYREACGRDQRVQELWGASAPFTAKLTN